MTMPDASNGVKLSLMIGPRVPVPAPAFVVEALESAEIARSDLEPSGFSLVFKLGKASGLAGDIPMLKTPLLKAGVRVVLSGVLGAVPNVLIDGIVEDIDSQPAQDGGSGTLTLKGRDLTALMDREEKSERYPGMAPDDIARVILARYAQYGVIPTVIPPIASIRDNPVERTPTQNGTDLAKLKEMAEANGYIFTLLPGPVPLSTIGYWGPHVRVGGLQPAITVDMGPETNVSNLSFELEESEVASVSGSVLEPRSGTTIPVRSLPSLRPPLALFPSSANTVLKKVRLLQSRAGQGPAEAIAAAQAQAETTTDTLKATGDLDIGKYGRLLKTSKLVGLRGAGFDHDGLYYVRDVIHKISKGAWTQSFTIMREGLGSTVPMVRP